MFTFFREASQLDATIDRAHLQLRALDPASDEYAAVLDQLIKLHKMQDADRPASISPDTLVMAATNLFGILLILNYERTEIVTTKALGFISKTR